MFVCLKGCVQTYTVSLSKGLPGLSLSLFYVCCIYLSIYLYIHYIYTNLPACLSIYLSIYLFIYQLFFKAYIIMWWHRNEVLKSPSLYTRIHPRRRKKTNLFVFCDSFTTKRDFWDKCRSSRTIVVLFSLTDKLRHWN